MNEAKRNALRALQESMDRRDNGGPAGLPESNGHQPHDPEARFDTHHEDTHHETAEPPVDVWAQARQREFASAS